MTTPAPRRSPAEQARLEAALTDLCERRMRFNQLIGIRVASIGPAGVTFGLDMRPELIGHDQYERLHGGVIASMLDALGERFPAASFRLELRKLNPPACPGHPAYAAVRLQRAGSI